MALQDKNDFNTLLNEMVKTMVALLEERDHFFRGHSERVANGCVQFAKKIGLNGKETNDIYLASLLHDIGMIFVPQSIIIKAEPLDEEEIALIQKHSLVAEKILSNITQIKDLLPMILHHHEASDGSGYPDGLKGEAIPMGARIICLFDCYDAMVSVRPNRAAFNRDEALKEMAHNQGSKFDKPLLGQFVKFINEIVTPSESALKTLQEEEDSNSIRDGVKKIVSDFKKGKIDLPVLPKIVDDVKKIINDPNSTVEAIGKVIEKDAVISVRLISVANSPIYRGASEILSVQKAIPRLGINEALTTVSAIANKSVYKTKNKHFSLVMEDLWRHSLASAMGAKILAKESRLTDLDKFFTLGLVHDIGKVILVKAFADIVPDADKLNIQQINETVQSYHTDFGVALLKRWKFSDDITHVVKQHEDTNVNKDTDKDVLIIQLANLITRKIGYSLFNDEGLVLSETDSAKALEIAQERLDEICNEAQQLMQETAHIF